MSGPASSVLSLLLSASLLANVGGPAAFRHAHAGGDRPHDHQGSSQGHHHDGLAHDDEAHGRAHRCPAETLAGGISHYHVRWLGFEFTVPVPPGEQDDRDDDPSSPDLAPLRLNGREAVTARDESDGPASVQRLLASAGTTIGPALAPLAQSTPRAAPEDAPAPPLCAQARHERSGVLLT